MARTPRTLPSTAELAEGTHDQVAEPLAEIAYRRIKAAILDGSLPPGLQAAEQQIAVQLGMSRTPVHMAIVRLQHDGWITLSARRGLVIAPIVPNDLQHIYETLMALEGTAVARLARRPAGDDDGIDTRITQACEATELALTQDDLSAWSEADGRFHHLLVEASGNPHLAQMARFVMEQAQRARNLTLRLRPRPEASNADHRLILQRILARDPAGARAALEAHRNRGIETLVPILAAMSQPRKFLHS
jgi:DNA-binding GntR family transcriptional regulator